MRRKPIPTDGGKPPMSPEARRALEALREAAERAAEKKRENPDAHD